MEPEAPGNRKPECRSDGGRERGSRARGTQKFAGGTESLSSRKHWGTNGGNEWVGDGRRAMGSGPLERGWEGQVQGAGASSPASSSVAGFLVRP